VFPHRHLLGIEGLSRPDIETLLDMAEQAVAVSRRVDKKRSDLRGRTQINLFYEPSTRTQASFEIAGKRLGADVMNMSVARSSESKGETLLDTAMTLNAMRPDIIVVRHAQAGAAHLLARKVDCSVVNAGDGAHEHPTQALLDALTIRRNKGRIEGLTIAICGDILHSRVARSNILLLSALGARMRVVGPSTLAPDRLTSLGVEVFHDMKRGLDGVDVVMMLRLQRERIWTLKRSLPTLFQQSVQLGPSRRIRLSQDVRDHPLRPAITSDVLYESVINRVYTSPDAFGRISNWKEIYQNHM